MPDEPTIGLSSTYQGGGAERPGPRQIFQMVVRKTEYRALMELESRRIAEALPYLSSTETEQLSEMLQGEIADCNADVSALAEQVDREAALAASTRAMDVRLSREASRALQAEMLRRIERLGFCQAPAQLTGEAVMRAYGEARDH
jgi:hypothetical protein